MDHTKRRILSACVCPMHAASISDYSGRCSPWLGLRVGLGLAGAVGCGGLVPIYESFSPCPSHANRPNNMNASTCTSMIIAEYVSMERRGKGLVDYKTGASKCYMSRHRVET